MDQKNGTVRKKVTKKIRKNGLEKIVLEKERFKGTQSMEQNNSGLT